MRCAGCAGREHDRWRGREHWHGEARAQTENGVRYPDAGGVAVHVGGGDAAACAPACHPCDHNGSPIARCPVQHLREMYRTKLVKGRSRSVVHGRAGQRAHPQFEPGKVVVGFKLVP